VHKLISCFLLLEQAKAQDLFSETREILIIVIVSDDLELTVAMLRIESKKLICTDMYVFFFDFDTFHRVARVAIASRRCQNLRQSEK